VFGVAFLVITSPIRVCESPNLVTRVGKQHSPEVEGDFFNDAELRSHKLAPVT
jgi:hypothetical protein